MGHRNRVRAGGKVAHGHRFTRTCGIDTDRDYLVVAFYDATLGHSQVEEFPQSAHGIDALAHKIKTHAAQLTVIESTGQYHLDAYKRLSRAGINIIVVNPLTIKALLRVEGKSDKRDAATLAQLAATFDLRASNMPDALQEELRFLFKTYDQAVQARIRIGNRLNATLVAQGCRLCQVVSRGTLRDRLLDLFLEGRPPKQIAAAHPQAQRRPAILDAVDGAKLSDPARHYCLWLQRQYRDYCATERTQLAVILGRFEHVAGPMLYAASVPGTSPEMLIRLAAECGLNFTERYATAERFCSALGVAPRSEVSGGKLLKVADTHGNARMVAMLTAHLKAWMLHLKGDRPLANWLVAYKARSTYSKTLLALAHKIAEGWYNCTKLKRSYDEYKAFGVKPPALPVETVVGKVDLQTGEILDERVPLEVDVPYATAFMLKAQAQLPEIWRYRREGD